jgi:hypothetical protein
MRRVALVSLAVLLVGAPVLAREVAGVTLAPTITIDGRSLALNGAGLRTRFFFKVYVIGLYLEHPSTDAAAILAADETRRADLRLLRALPGPEIADAIGRAFEQNAGPAAPALHERLTRFEAMFPSVAVGDAITLTYAPGPGVTVAVNGRAVGVIPGKDFADVLFSVWIGAAPIDATLKQALLTGP